METDLCQCIVRQDRLVQRYPNQQLRSTLLDSVVLGYRRTRCTPPQGVRNTRTGSSTLRIPHHRTTVFNKSFLVSACRLWNSLPDPLKSLESRDRFASAVKLYFLQRMSAAVVP
ncbi:hypothetical protein J6590_086942 [Homalodisca vitripennis]|nr:hypothetical protein J6590_086942 [Homalodisca vitripennis]